MQNSENKNRIVQQVAESNNGICKICGKVKRTAMYRFRHEQIVPTYVPPLLTPVCRWCVYKEVYGSKNWRKKMKEGALDG